MFLRLDWASINQIIIIGRRCKYEGLLVSFLLFFLWCARNTYLMEGDAQVEHDIKVDIFLGPNPPLIG